ncbi:MAG TPA: SUMF1/EgtB/PvdO family nonheme iron enzyme [Xanthobacteraceae bacterium]|nr:SUMF1/EgtB/PvdO family nonheme iron enzyme [Xanthobacteraceae bacterium]
MRHALKIKLAAAAAVAAVAVGPIALGQARLAAPPPQSAVEPRFVLVAPGERPYRAAGEFTREGRPVDAPLVTVRLRGSLAVMQRQVTAGEYAVCVAEGACPATGIASDPARPAVKVSWRDATAYARWLSAKTGRRYRLPTDEEWAFAAGTRWRDDAVAVSDTNDPARRWLARYDAEAAREEIDKEVRPVGAFGVNENGLADIAGNVWEWTDTCFRRVRLDAAGRESVASESFNCGVRVVAGRHRTYMSDFVRDPRSGGCAFGVPPSNLGFRLVRDDEEMPIASRMVAPILRALRADRG